MSRGLPISYMTTLSKYRLLIRFCLIDQVSKSMHDYFRRVLYNTSFLTHCFVLLSKSNLHLLEHLHIPDPALPCLTTVRPQLRPPPPNPPPVSPPLPFPDPAAHYNGADPRPPTKLPQQALKVLPSNPKQSPHAVFLKCGRLYFSRATECISQAAKVSLRLI